MRIERIEITNFASLAKVELTDLPNLVVFVGKNSSGKSNVIDALALLFTEFGNDLDRNLGNLDDLQHIFHGYVTDVIPNPTISVLVTMSAEEWAEVLSVDEPSVHDWSDTEILLEKSIVRTEGSVRWVTASVKLGNVDLVRNGGFEQDVIHVRDGNNEEPPLLVPVDHFYEKLTKLMQSSFEVITPRIVHVPGQIDFRNDQR